MITDGRISDGFFWFNEPDFDIRDGRLSVVTSPDTDFWQGTHYGFRRDNGHCLFAKVRGDFSLVVRTEFHPKKQYDQCGLMLRIDPENWIKASVEYETGSCSRLGSVVTSLGYSDWATIDIDSTVRTMWYRMQTRGNDVLIEYSHDGTVWKQLRIAHIHRSFSEMEAGVYACSPMQSSFEAIFDRFVLEESHWKKS